MPTPTSRFFKIQLTLALLAASVSCSASRQDSVWNFRTDRPWLAGDSDAFTPVVDRDSAFFCGGYFWNDDDAIHALSSSDGRLVWKHQVGDCRDAPWLVAGTLVVHSKESTYGPCVFQGFDPATGQVRWRREFHTDVPLSTTKCTMHGAVAGDSIVFAYLDDQDVHAVHAADGTLERFEFPVERRRTAPLWLTASGSDAWFGFGTRLWRWPSGRAQPEEAIGLSQDAEAPEYAAASGTRLFLGGGYSAAWLRAFDLRTGQLLWEREALPRILSLTVDEGLYLNIWRRRYELIAVDVNTGQELWTAGVGGFFPPMWKDGWLYGNGEFSIFVADPTSGRIVRTIEAEDEVTTTPIRTGDLLLFGTINGALHAVRPGELERPAGR